ncbi:MAG: T9SS type A sorting domain-containing protein [Bacteroidota bacterium]
MKKFLFVINFLFIGYFTFAQNGEKRSSLTENFELSQYAKLHPDKTERIFGNNIYSKTGLADSSFPFIERFTNPGTFLLFSNWADANVTRIGQSVMFDAFDRFGNVYPGNHYGQADSLTSQPIRLTVSSNLYLEFNYSGGSTWYDGDSLILQILDKNGKWKRIWYSSIYEVNKTITLPIDQTSIPLDSLDPTHIVFRFINLTNLYSGITEDFILNYFVFAHKLDLPAYDNMSVFSEDSFPSKVYWSQAKTKIAIGSQLGLPWCNPAVFDAFDENKKLYSNTAGTGFADTLASHYIDLSNFTSKDSVFLRFYYRAMPSSKPADSLFLEFKNSSGLWIRVKGFSGSPFNNFKLFSQYVNFTNFKSAFFQFRLINKTTYTLNDTSKWIVSGFNFGKKLSLPLIEDFSSSKIFPDPGYWKDKLVYINNHFPIDPPSFNVATFDGLDNRGNPYGFGRGYCDSLTTWPINLSGYTVADSIYLSFFIEPKGLGEKPSSNDSFIVEMRNSPYDPNAFTTVWGTVASKYPDTAFTQIFIKIDSSYLHDDFQFRFKNIGSLTGNLKHWNLDYIRLDRGRNKNDTSYTDDAISTAPQSLLKTYSSLPWGHYILNKALFDIDTQYFYLKNNSNNSHNTNYYRVIYDQQKSVVETYSNIINNFPAGQIYKAFVPKTNPLVTPSATVDTVLFTCKYSLKEATSVDNIPSNDTFVTQQIFSNYFAYDDGSAEAGYDVANRPGSVALGYNLPKADTLYGIALFFNQSAVNVSGRSFNFKVWKDIAQPPAQSGETLLKDIIGNPCEYPFSGPVYQNKINGFYYYKFHDPIAVDGKFYIGWQQSTIFELNIGLDQNYQVNGKYATNPMMYYKTTDVPQWQQTQLTGALMMRPIVGKWIDPPLAVKEYQHFENTILVFPNPASNMVNIQSNKAGIFSVELMDMTGRLILSEKTEGQLSLPSLQTGIYLLKITDEDQQSLVKKIIIQQ